MNRSSSTFALLLLMLSVPLLISCGSDINEDIDPDNVQAFYFMEYSYETDTTTVSSYFVYSNSYYELDADESITFNGSELTKFSDRGLISYYKEYPGLIDTGTFEFNNFAGKTFTNTINQTSDISPKFPLDITVTNGGTVKWIGSPVQEGQTITLYIRSLDNGSVFKEELTTKGATQFSFGKSKLPEYISGDVEVAMFRTHPTELEEQTPAGGVISAIYVSNLYTVNIKL